MEARPTQFKGVNFKSKTEAMFALILDVSKQEYPIPSRWCYEEKRFKTPNGYIPDFVNYYSEQPFLSDFISLIEVKPTYPTAAYLKHLEKQFNWIKNNDNFCFINWYSIYVFNPYKRICEFVLLDENGTLNAENYSKPQWFKEDLFDLALNYRFDLIY